MGDGKSIPSEGKLFDRMSGVVNRALTKNAGPVVNTMAAAMPGFAKLLQDVIGDGIFQTSTPDLEAIADPNLEVMITTRHTDDSEGVQKLMGQVNAAFKRKVEEQLGAEITVNAKITAQPNKEAHPGDGAASPSEGMGKIQDSLWANIIDRISHGKGSYRTGDLLRDCSDGRSFGVNLFEFFVRRSNMSGGLNNALMVLNEMKEAGMEILDDEKVKLLRGLHRLRLKISTPSQPDFAAELKALNATDPDAELIHYFANILSAVAGMDGKTVEEVDFDFSSPDFRVLASSDLILVDSNGKLTLLRTGEKSEHLFQQLFGPHFVDHLSNLIASENIVRVGLDGAERPSNRLYRVNLRYVHAHKKGFLGLRKDVPAALEVAYKFEPGEFNHKRDEVISGPFKIYKVVAKRSQAADGQDMPAAGGIAPEV